jgi:hypothetical protein
MRVLRVWEMVLGRLLLETLGSIQASKVGQWWSPCISAIGPS